MGAAGLIDIKRRIKSVESTRKITKAMGLVATSKLRKARTELTAKEQYNKLSREIVDKVLNSSYEGKNSIYLKNNSSGDKLYIVLTSDTGFCGGFNNNAVAKLNESITESKAGHKIILVGGKGISYLEKYNLSAYNQYVDLPEIPTSEQMNKIYNDAIYLYKKGEVSEINLVFTEFKSPVRQEVKTMKLLPFDNADGKATERYIIEPDEEHVLSNAMDVYMKSQLIVSMISSRASEQSARMTAMDSATENANDILQDLHVKFNRIRQSIITQEISEIVGGAEAQK